MINIFRYWLSFNIFCKNITKKYVIQTHNISKDIKIKRPTYTITRKDTKHFSKETLWFTHDRSSKTID